MNRYSDFQPKRTAERSAAYAFRRRSSSSCDEQEEYYAPPAQREKRAPKRVRPRQRANLQSLYPSTRNMPDIPLAAVVFNKAKLLKYTPERQEQQQHHDTTNTLSDESDKNSNNNNNNNNNGSVPDKQQQDNPVEDDTTVSTTSVFERPLVEVSPGHWVELRGSEETWNALQRNFYVKVECFCCTIHMHAISDAAMVLCPECRMIVPFNDDGKGLGLGVRVESEQRTTTTNTTVTSLYQMKNPPHISTSASSKKEESWGKDDNGSCHSLQKVRAPTSCLGSLARATSISSEHLRGNRAPSPVTQHRRCDSQTSFSQSC